MVTIFSRVLVFGGYMPYWLVKTEPSSFSIDDLENAPNKISMWDGVRNYQARNFMRDAMEQGDQVLFYHSVTQPGIVGLAEVASKSYPDPTQWDPESKYFDPKSPHDSPRWYLVDIRFIKKFARPLSLQELRGVRDLEHMELLRKGSRLSIQPVRKEEFDCIIAMAQ